MKNLYEFSYTSFPDGYSGMKHYLSKKQNMMQTKLSKSICVSDNVVLYGAGQNGLSALKDLRANGVEPACFYDSDEGIVGTILCGIPIISSNALPSLARDSIIIITPYYHSLQIEDMLRGLGFDNIYLHNNIFGTHITLKFYKQKLGEKQAIVEKDKHKIVYVLENLADKHSVDVFNANMELWLHGTYQKAMDSRTFDGYYPKGIINLSTEEVFVDCGAYTGDSLIDFAERTRNKYRMIYAYEPDDINFEILRRTVVSKKIENVQLNNIGIFSGKETLNFTTSDGVGNRLTDDGGKKIEVDSLDNLLKDRLHPVTFIKVDIEGAEMAALQGAQNIIAEDAPKLAISAYHKFGDMWRIPNFLLKHFPNYNIYFRNVYTFYDFICYAVKKT